MTSRDILMRQLEATAEMIQWAISCVPEDRLLEEPPHGRHPNSDQGFKTYFGQWSAYRLLFHLVYYEESHAVPTMRHWLGDPHPAVDLMIPDAAQEESRWKEELERGADLPALQERFRLVREEQISLVRSIPDEDWGEEKVSTGLGTVSAEVVVAKTVQHTLEHGNDILRNALYWDRALEWLDSRE